MRNTPRLGPVLLTLRGPLPLRRHTDARSPALDAEIARATAGTLSASCDGGGDAMLDERTRLWLTIGALFALFLLTASAVAFV